jgi:hypothetical protein
MINLKTFPKISDKGGLTSYEREVIQWEHDLETVIKERINNHLRMIDTDSV